MESIQEAGWNSPALVLVLAPFRHVVPRRGISYPAPPFPPLWNRPGRGLKGCVDMSAAHSDYCSWVDNVRQLGTLILASWNLASNTFNGGQLTFELLAWPEALLCWKIIKSICCFQIIFGLAHCVDGKFLMFLKLYCDVASKVYKWPKQCWKAMCFGMYHLLSLHLFLLTQWPWTSGLVSLYVRYLTCTVSFSSLCFYYES